MTPSPTIKNGASRDAKPKKAADGHSRASASQAVSGNNLSNRILMPGILGIIVFSGLYFIELYNHLLFHSLVEIFAIVVAGGIFFVSWNSREFSDNNYFLFLGIAYLFIGAFDLLHALAYSGTHIFRGDTADMATQLWISSRYIESISLFIAPFFLNRKFQAKFVFSGYLIVVSVLWGTIFYWRVFPVCFTATSGLTEFKKDSEYIISFILLAAIGLLFQRREGLDAGCVRLLIASMALSIASEMAVTFYISVYGLSDLIGHYLKLISFYFIYKAIIEASLKKPYNLLFRSLKQSEARFQSLVQSSTDHIFMLDRAGYYLFSNDALHHLQFDKGSDITNRHLRDVYPPELAAFYLQILNQVLSTGKPVDFEHTLGEPDDLHYHLDTLFPIIKDGRIESVGGICRDITERKHAEQRLQEHVARLQMLRDIDRAVLELQPPDQIAKTLLPRLRKIIPCNRASVCLFDRQTWEIVVLAVDEDKDSHLGAGSRLSLEKTDLSRVVLQGEIQLVKDAKTLGHNFSAGHIVKATRSRSYLNVPLKFKRDIIGCLNFGSEIPDNFSRNQITIAQEVANSLSVALQNSRLFNSVSKHREQLRVLALRLTENEETQRHQLVREVHDQVGQNLTALNIKLNMVLNALSRETSKALYKQVEDALDLVTETTVRIRNLMSDLRPPVLDDYGLPAALEWYAEKFSERYGLPVKTMCAELTPRLELRVEAVLFRIAQEALTNIIRHARAGRVLLELDEARSTVRMRISDNGRGFTVAEKRKSDRSAGWGLMTMQEHIASLGGKLIIKSEPGKGTTIEAVMTRKVYHGHSCFHR